MNVYVLINSRKIRSKVKSSLSYLKIVLKDVKNNKKYSSIIVNDIKIDFTLISKSLNSNKSVSAKNVFKQKIPNISTIENQKMKFQEKPKPKANILFMKKEVRSGTMTNLIRVFPMLLSLE